MQLLFYFFEDYFTFLTSSAKLIKNQQNKEFRPVQNPLILSKN